MRAKLTSDTHTHTLRITDCDSAIIGQIDRCGQPTVIVYDYLLLIQAFQAQGMTEDEAIEHISYNVEGAWVGEGTPAVMHPVDEDEEDGA